MTTETSQSTGAAAKNATDFTAVAQRRAPPNPALRILDRFVSTWYTRGRTLDSGVVNIMCRTTFEFLPGRGSRASAESQGDGVHQSRNR